MAKTANERFWALVNKDGPVQTHCAKLGQCWEWTGLLNGAGYGIFSLDGKLIRSHRYAYKLNFGDCPDNLQVCHKCDNRKCVNWDHLFLGTATDNMKDMREKGRGIRGSKHFFAKLKEEQVMEIKFSIRAKVSFRKLAKTYGVSIAEISKIAKGKVWKHVS